MKIEALKEVSVTSNVPTANVTNMTISEDGMQHIMSLLTNLYKDPELAVIREYFTNACDAHVAVGSTNPVDITLPTWDSPVYVVQDYGIGMSEEDIRKIYSQYGASTKRLTNDQVGAFGLGCKSALTITQQFTLVSVKDGMKTTALISKSESGVNTVNVISNIESDDLNGTTVKIPVPDIYSFNNKAKKFFAFTAPEKVVIDGYTPGMVYASMKEIANPDDSDKIYIKPSDSGASYLVMGDVPYSISQEEMAESVKRLGLSADRQFLSIPKIFIVPIGSVDLTPSREGLRYTDKTNEILDKKVSFVLKDLRKIAQEEVDECTDLKDVFKKMHSWKDYFSDPLTEWNGEKVKHYIDATNSIRGIRRTAYGASEHSTFRRLSLNYSYPVIILKGLKESESSKVSRYIKPYIEDQGITGIINFLLVEDKEVYESDWIKKSSLFTVMDPQDLITKGKAYLKAQRALAPKETKPREKIQYPVLVFDSEEIVWKPCSEISSGTPYLGGNRRGEEFHSYISSVYSQGFDKDVPDYIMKRLEGLSSVKEVILLGNNRTAEALARRVKDTYPFVDDVKKTAESLKSMVTESLVQYHSMNSSRFVSDLKDLKLAKVADTILDPEVVAAIDAAGKGKAEFDKFEALAQKVRAFNATYSMVPSLQIKDEIADALSDKYPLLRNIESGGWGRPRVNPAEVVIYMNAVYEKSLLDSSAVV